MPVIVYNTLQAAADLKIQIVAARNIQQNYVVGSTGWTTQQGVVQALQEAYTAAYGSLGMLPGGNLDLGGQ